MELEKITIDPTLLTYVAQALGRVPESLMTFRRLRTCPAAAGRFTRN